MNWNAAYGPECREVVITPSRFLSDSTVSHFLTELKNVGGLLSVLFHGPNYIRRKIELDDEIIELSLKVGKIYIIIEDEAIAQPIKSVCDEVFKHPYHISMAPVPDRKPTVTEQLGNKSVMDVKVTRKELDYDTWG